MTTVVGSDAQPATGHGSATVPADTRDERASPRSLAGSGILERIKPSDYDDIIKLDEFLCLNDTNWVRWHIEIMNVFRICGVEGYVKGTLPRPDPTVDPEGAESWSYNDAYTRLIISFNVTQSQKSNTSMCKNAHEVWKDLEGANRSQESRTLLGNKRKLCHTTAGERDNIVEHLDKLKKYRQQMNFAAMDYTRFGICDSDFNKIVAESLPPSWDLFTGRYVGTQTFGDDDPGTTTISSQRFIELIEQEYRRREQWDREFLARRPTHVTTYVGPTKLCFS
jgi:hypothetical protein